MKLMVNTIFDCQETAVESKDTGTAITPANTPKCWSSRRSWQWHQNWRAGAVNHSLAHFKKETVIRFASVKKKLILMGVQAKPFK